MNPLTPARLCLSLLLLGALSAPAGGGAPQAEPEPAQNDRATATHGFEDVERWVSVFDDPGREAWQMPERLTTALELRPGDVVADIGAGTGYFNAHWSRAVGENGAVFAVDVEPRLVAHMRDRAEREGTANLIPVIGSLDDPRLPPTAVDVVVLVNAYHHVDRRRDYFRRLRSSLAPGGRLVIIDWRKEGEIPVGPEPSHRVGAAQAAEELRAAGYVEVRRIEFLPYQYCRIFRLAPAVSE